ncbi:MAG: hypothetical protein KGM43_10135 [Planctomycetota bacterium]|nr:hypothetical protein [Planctomycetota bacterium]
MDAVVSPAPTPPGVGRSPARLLLDGSMSASHRLVLLALPELASCSSTGCVAASDEAIAAASGFAVRTVRRALASGERLGYITRVAGRVLARLRPDLGVDLGGRVIVLHWALPTPLCRDVVEGPPEASPANRDRGMREEASPAISDRLDIMLPPRAQPSSCDAVREPALACVGANVTFSLSSVPGNQMLRCDASRSGTIPTLERLERLKATLAERESREPLLLASTPASPPRPPLTTLSQGNPRRPKVQRLAASKWAREFLAELEASPGDTDVVASSAAELLAVKFGDTAPRTVAFWSAALRKLLDGTLAAAGVAEVLASACAARSPARLLSKRLGDLIRESRSAGY